VLETLRAGTLPTAAAGVTPNEVGSAAEAAHDPGVREAGTTGPGEVGVAITGGTATDAEPGAGAGAKVAISTAEKSMTVGASRGTRSADSTRRHRWDVTWDLAWQSRSGPPQVPWLQPDVIDRLSTLRSGGIDTVVVVPLGFVSDHMEVVHDLDSVALGHARRLGLTAVRAATPGTHPRFVAMVRELIEERLDGREPVAVGRLAARPQHCPENCCPP
jgi:hypothetical protein